MRVTWSWSCTWALDTLQTPFGKLIDLLYIIMSFHFYLVIIITSCFLIVKVTIQSSTFVKVLSNNTVEVNGPYAVFTEFGEY